MRIFDNTESNSTYYDKNMKNKIIKIFEDIRDIPFRIPLASDEPNCDCTGKSILLKKQLEKIGVEARFGVCWFYWDDLKLPEEISSIPHDKDCTHTFVEIFMDNRWIKLDPSWDIALGVKFTIAHFDGSRDTALMVKPIEFFTPEKSAEIINNQINDTCEVIANDLERNGAFYRALNIYLESIRKAGE